MDFTELKTQLMLHGQEHVLMFLDRLSDDQKRSLYADLKEVDLSKVSRCWQEAQKNLADSQEKKDEHLQPLDRSIVGSTARDRAAVKTWENIGEYYVLMN